VRHEPATGSSAGGQVSAVRSAWSPAGPDR
jgi:hypothetical protein